MSEEIKIGVSGIVRDRTTNRPVEGAVVLVEGEEKERYVAHTDEHGRYVVEVPLAKFRITAMARRFQPESVAFKEYREGVATVNFGLFPLMGPHDASWGYAFGGFLILLVWVLTCIYAGLHLSFPNRAEPLSRGLLATIEEADALLAGEVKPEMGQVISATLEAIEAGWAAALDARPQALADADRQAGTRLIANARQAFAQGEPQVALGYLRELGALVRRPRDPGFFWTREPWRLLEALYAGAVGIAVNLLITVGWYLRRRTFYAAGLPMHIAQLVTAPILAMVTVLVLSIVGVRISVFGAGQPQLDLSDPKVLFFVALLTGLIPWDVWRFARGTAQKILSVSEES